MELGWLQIQWVGAAPLKALWMGQEADPWQRTACTGAAAQTAAEARVADRFISEQKGRICDVVT